MINSISDQNYLAPQQVEQYNNKSLGMPAGKGSENLPESSRKQDSVTINYQQEVSMTYSSSLTIQTGDGQDQYNLLRGLVTNMLKEQGIDFKVATGDQEIDISSISQEEAVELIAEDGYFGVEQTSDRIVEFAIGIAGGDPSRLEAIKEGVDKGFAEAFDAFGGWLPEISYDTYDAVMNKLDAWAEVDSPEEVS
ncbi:hypothetical protein UWK_03103 [Desulfocapsa sulfexigens DSM 10523]|uniref:DUF5610 domain-containing protein n=1 Tax=Desulfocapsa sulfexigens (strain DSM 10523 / SB164P1) TaxID=1167006 RepID=M1PDG0_DESSD|nr:hypothetical protein [Desulfocapsa sulfexigens]AGF79632.1 hypothetical protein UWK_03103 [Desulfocapsa sulfexigens DSM 10523]